MNFDAINVNVQNVCVQCTFEFENYRVNNARDKWNQFVPCMCRVRYRYNKVSTIRKNGLYFI